MRTSPLPGGTPTSPDAVLSGREKAYAYVKNVIIPDRRFHNSFITEEEVASLAGVSRTPVREAVLILSTEDLIQLVPRRGIYIAAPSVQEVGELVDFRRLIEQAAAKRAAGGGAVDVDAMDKIIDNQERMISSAEGATAFIEEDFRFHSTMVECLENSLIERSYHSLQGRQVRAGVVTVYKREDRRRAVIEEHRAITAALRSGEEAAILVAIDRHLDQTLRSMTGAN